MVLVLLTHLKLSAYFLSRRRCTLIKLTSLIIVMRRVHGLLLFLGLQLFRIVIIQSFTVSSKKSTCHSLACHHAAALSKTFIIRAALTRGGNVI